MRGAVSIGLLLAAGCAGSNLRMEINPPPDPLRVVAMAPAQLRYGPSPYEIERRSEDVLAGLWASSAWPILSPTEFVVLDPDARDPLMGTDLLSRTRALRIAPEHIGVLKTKISLREAHGQAVVRGARGTAVGSGYQGTAVVTLELYSAGGRLVAEIETTEPLDPFAPKPDWDAKPEIRVAIARAVTELTRACRDCVTDGPTIALPPTHPSAATVVRAYRNVLRNPATWTKTAEGAEHQLQVWRAMQYFDPTVGLERATGLDGRPAGFCFMPPVPPPLRAGDCVLAVDGTVSTSPHTLRRLVGLAGGRRTFQLTVMGLDGVARTVPWAP